MKLDNAQVVINHLGEIGIMCEQFDLCLILTPTQALNLANALFKASKIVTENRGTLTNEN